MKVGIANDHKGFELKQELTNYLKEKGYNVINYGTDDNNSTDYPIYAFTVGEAIKNNEIDFGILICGTGIGMSIACNKVKSVRCAKVNTKEEAILTRKHNNANVIALSCQSDAKEIVNAFLETDFSNEERHVRRNEMVNNYDN